MTEPRPQYDATKRKLKPMTDYQAALLTYLIGYKRMYSDSPTYAEIMRAVGMTSQSHVYHSLRSLEKRGRLRLLTIPGRRAPVIVVTGGRWVYEPPSEATP